MLLLLLILLLVSFWLLIKKQYSYWDNTKIPHLKANFPLGIMSPIVQKERSFGLLLSDIYEKSTEKLLGIYVFFRPTLLIRDAQLARQILISDFSSFHDRGFYLDEKYDPLSANLSSLTGQNWQTLRTKLTPSFTSSKLKAMFEIIDDVGERMVKHLNKELVGFDYGKAFELRNVMTTYAVDIVGSVIFGLDIDSFTNPNNEVRKLHTEAFALGGFLKQAFYTAIFLCAPLAKLMTRLGYRQPELQHMRQIMAHTIQLREQRKITRKDLLQMFIQLRNTGKISDENDKTWDVETVADHLKSLSIDAIAANAFLFYIAGSESTGAAASYTIYEISMYPDLLRRAQAEVKAVLERHNIRPGRDKLTYDALQDMKFIDLCLMETLRKYPGLPFLNRECSKDYYVPNTDYVIKKGTPILISVYGLHRDPEYFPDPSRYDPERFLDDHQNYNSAAYMPFGEGPRHCIAQRLGKINSKIAVVKILANFEIKTRARKEVDFKFDVSPILLAKDGLNVHLSKKH